MFGVISTNVVLSTLLHPDSLEQRCGIVMMLTSPFIIGTMGWLSWSNELAWSLFIRSVIGLILVITAVALEEKLCSHSLSVYYHAIVDHACIWCMFGGVAQNVVHITHLSLTRQAMWDGSLVYWPLWPCLHEM